MPTPQSGSPRKPSRPSPSKRKATPARSKAVPATPSKRTVATAAASDSLLSALTTSLAGRAKTIIYVHGIGNKPVASVLKCQWDHALFGFDLGERSRLAYWVNRERFPEPEAGTCVSGDLTAVEEEPAGKGMSVQAAADAISIESEVAELTAKPSEQRVLLAIADEIESDQPAVSEAEIRVRAVEARLLPVPAVLRRWVTKKLTRAFLRDVNDFFFEADRRKVMEDSVLERLAAGGGPFVVIGHSQGSMIAYDVLSRFKKADLDVDLFVTIGSPLGIQEVQDQIKKITGQKKLAVPECVRAWLNVADPLDPVALKKRLAGEYQPTGGVAIADDPGWNPDSPRHPHSGSGYLSMKPVRTMVREAVDTALFQPVASFVIARDVARAIEDGALESRHQVLIELAEVTGAGDRQLDKKREEVVAKLEEMAGPEKGRLKIEALKRFVAAELTRTETERLAWSLGDGSGCAVRRIWKNSAKRALIEASVNTVQARPAHIAYRATGEGIHWAVLDSGVYAEHPHFATHGTIAAQYDCTLPGELKAGTAPDEHGHGTHVGGIIAGELTVEEPPKPGTAQPAGRERQFFGMAPLAKLHVYKVLDRQGDGKDSWIIKALDHIAETNERAGQLVIQGANLSLGGGFDQSVYACGHSPLCRELRRLWRQGVVVVLAAGNEGFAVLATEGGSIEANMALSIGDPANLEEAIAVGSVHKENPHTFGVSYFSSRGPTADGRQKPDVVAPGERILSCRHRLRSEGTADDLYVAMSGTSMAAPHVSGVIAAFLSLRREFIGYPDRVKEILLGSCTDLRRHPPQQGAGLPNLVKMLVST